MQQSRKSAFSAKCRERKIGKRDGHGKSGNGHGKVMEKYFLKYVGTLKLYWMVTIVAKKISRNAHS